MFVLTPLMMMNTSATAAPSEEEEEEESALPSKVLGKPDQVVKVVTTFPAKKPSSSTTSSSSTSTPSPPRRSRKRVRFEYDLSSSSSNDGASSSSSSTTTTPLHNHYQQQRAAQDEQQPPPVKRRILDWLPTCSELSEYEKQLRWLSAEEQEEIRRQRSTEAARVRQQDACLAKEGQAHLSYTNTYSSIYAICNRPTTAKQQEEQQQQQQQPNEGDDDSSSSSAAGDEENGEEVTTTAAAILPDLLTFLGTGRHADTRGLEDRTVPWLAVERRLARVTAIRAIVQTAAMVQQLPADGSKPDAGEAVLRRMSRTLSRPARRLGEALAVADATAAMVEYAATSSSSTVVETTAATVTNES